MKTLEKYRRQLPHWRLDGAIYFVTWRLASSQPPLNAAERTVVRDALLFADRKSFDLLAHVVMDDHVHVLVRPRIQLEKVIHSWKSFTTHEVLKGGGRTGRLWQFEYYDRIMRDAEEVAEKLRYILSNPAKRWPGLADYEWAGARNPCWE